MPAYGVVILLVTFIIPHLYDGPFWAAKMWFEADKCKNYWWFNILPINNFMDIDRIVNMIQRARLFMCIQRFFLLKWPKHNKSSIVWYFHKTFYNYRFVTRWRKNKITAEMLTVLSLRLFSRIFIEICCTLNYYVFYPLVNFPIINREKKSSHGKSYWSFSLELVFNKK